jgi:hypothetical protein
MKKIETNKGIFRKSFFLLKYSNNEGVALKMMVMMRKVEKENPHLDREIWIKCKWKLL